MLSTFGKTSKNSFVNIKIQPAKTIKSGLYFLRRFARSVEYSKDLANLLKKYSPDLIVLAGWILILTKEFFEVFPKVLNIHPGLIPDSVGGKVYFPDGGEAPSNKEMHTEDAIASFLDGGYKFAGSTVHFVTPSVDWGPVVSRDFEEIKKGDTLDSLYSRLKKKEHFMLVKAIKLFCEGKLTIEDSVAKV